MSIALAFVLAALLTVGALRLLLRGPFSGWHDLPNERSLHASPVPRIGGLGIHAGWIPVAAAAAALGLRTWIGWGPAAGLALIVAVSLWDDRHSIGPLARLIVQAAAAVALVASIGQPALQSAWSAAGGAAATVLAGPTVAAVAVLLVLAVLWMMNLYNFMDGADGLAGGMAVFGFGTYAVLAGPAAPGLAVASAAVAGAAAGFLRFNFPPARVFMGDAGSVPLGFLAAAFGLAGIAANVWGWWLPLLAFLPFVADASFTLLRRALRGERIWQAHREHGYQKLILLGWSHRRCALAWYAAMACCTATSIALAQMPSPVQWTTLGAMAALALAILSAIELVWMRRNSKPTT